MRTALIFLLLSFSTFSKAAVNDTISNWQFYIDDSLVVGLNVHLQGYQYNILQSDLKDKELLTFQMYHCTYCPDCSYELIVNDLIGNLIWSEEQKERQAIRVSIDKILALCTERNICEFDIWHYSKSSGDLPIATHVLRLVLD